MSIRETIRVGFSLGLARFKSRNEGSVLGILWYLLDPILLFTLLLSIRWNIAPFDSDFPVYLLSGIIMFNFFAHSTTLAINAIEDKGRLITTTKVNLEAIVFSIGILFLIPHLFELLLIAGVMYFIGLSVFNIFLYILWFPLFFVFTLGVSYLLAAIGAHFIDIDQLWRAFTRILFFASPIFYIIPFDSKYFFIATVNPLYYFFSLGRAMLMNQPVQPFILIGAVGFSVMIFWYWFGNF